eukprot:TRINITY_DN429_c0_g1_i3.p1 TRINITY_DN429_c0_g1~~TRINITY_DN429_c0_g1_i3.p1  ORF type:complete len:385 (+),score=56.46 TRINITY_DN429_c0_g1_i3:73-1155(+)
MFRALSLSALRPSVNAGFYNQIRYAGKKAKLARAKAGEVPEEAAPPSETPVFKKREKASTKTTVTKRLAPHPAGCSIEFNPTVHRYIVKGRKGHNLKSVTGLLRSPLTNEKGEVLSPVTHPFDLEGVALRIAERDGKTVDEVKQEWEDIATFGSQLHHFIYNNLTGEKLPNDVYWTDEELEAPRPKAYQEAYLEYMELLNSFGYSLYPNGSEMIVASLKYNLAGTIDCLLQCPEGNKIDPNPHLLLVDWKTNKSKLRGGRPFPGAPQSLNWPFTCLPAVKSSEYSLQTNCYRRILEVEGYIREPLPIKMAIAQFIQQASGKVIVDGIAVPKLKDSQIDQLFEAANPKKAKEARERLPFSF